MPPAKLPQGDDRRRQHGRLQHLKGHGPGADPVKGQKQIINRGNMNRKMRERTVPLHCGHRKAGGPHLMEHLGKNPEVIRRRSIGQHPAPRPKAHKCCRRGRRFCAAPTTPGIHTQNGQNHQTPQEIAGCQRRAQRHRNQNAKHPKHGPPLCLHRVKPPGQAEQQPKYSRRQAQQQPH